jgi:hypothetical protein
MEYNTLLFFLFFFFFFIYLFIFFLTFFFFLLNPIRLGSFSTGSSEKYLHRPQEREPYPLHAASRCNGLGKSAPPARRA